MGRFLIARGFRRMRGEVHDRAMGPGRRTSWRTHHACWNGCYSRRLRPEAPRWYLPSSMAHFSERVEEIDELLQSDPVEGFRFVVSLLNPPPTLDCDHARLLDCFGTACRVFGDLERAEDAYREADNLCRCKACGWDRLRRQTYLRSEQGLPDLAWDLAASAISAAPNRAMVGRCRVAAAYAQLTAGADMAAVETARQALAELDRSDVLYAVGAVTTMGCGVVRSENSSADSLRQARDELRELRRRWPRSLRYRSARGKTSWVAALLGYRLRDVDPCELRGTFKRVQRLHVEIGMWRDAIQLTVEGAEICSEMKREDLVASMILAMLDVLPESLPRHVATALRRLRRSLGAIDRREILRAATAVREAMALRPSPVL